MAALSTPLPTGPRGRALAVLVTFVGLAVLWLGAISPLLDWYASGADDLARQTALAGRMQDLVDALPELRRQIAASQPRDTPAASLLEGTSDAVAAATLQGRLEAMCASVGAKITSAEALPAEQVGAYRRIGLRVSVDASWAKLTGLLQAVQKATPRMFVDDLQLHAQPTNEKVRELPLDIALTLLAFRLPGAAAASPVAAIPAATDPSPPVDAAPAPPAAGAAPAAEVPPAPTAPPPLPATP